MLRELGLSSLQKKRFTGGSSQCPSIPEGKVQREQTLFSGADFQDKKQWTQDGTQEIPSEYQEALCCAGDSALAKAAKRDPRVYVLGDP